MIGTRAERETKGKASAIACLLAVVSLCVLLAASPAHAATFTVNSTDDEGDQSPSGVCNTAPFPVGTEPECTLRAAIQEANATTAADTIAFDIGGSGVKTISPTTAFPAITEPVTIDGYSEPDATENTLVAGDNANLRIRLDGAGTQGISFGLSMRAADNCVVRGLSITGFPGDGLEISVGDNNTIEGNFVGITPSGEDMGNGSGISIRNGASGNTVGGTTPQERNIVSGNGPSSQLSGTGVGISDSTTANNKVMGNYIGTTKSGTGDMGNTGRGIFVGNETSGNVVGDDDPSDGSPA